MLDIPHSMFNIKHTQISNHHHYFRYDHWHDLTNVWCGHLSTKHWLDHAEKSVGMSVEGSEKPT